MSRIQSTMTAFIGSFAERIRTHRRSGFFSDEWLLDGDYNRGSRLHGRLWAAMIQATPKGLIPCVEVRLHTPAMSQKSFKPDLVLMRTSDDIEMMVELESTSSCGQWFVERDIERLKHISNDERPEMVLLITVLPSAQVRRFSNWDGLDAAERQKRNSNPYIYYRDGYLHALDSLLSAGPSMSVAWANLDVDGIFMEFWDGRYSRRRYWSTR